MKTISTKLPNPDSNNDPHWSHWDAFIVSHGVPTCNEEVVRRYQNIEQTSWNYLEASSLNHFLNLRHFGLNSHYAIIAGDVYDLAEQGYPVDASLSALEAVFDKKSCRFTADSLVFKGVSSEPFYEILEFKLVQPGAKIHFPGFVSTSVCKEKAIDFVHAHGVLLVIRGLDMVDCIVPENLKVNTTVNANVPEHEVLLRRGVSMEVQHVITATSASPHEIHLQVI